MCKELISCGAKLDVLCDYPDIDTNLFGAKIPYVRKNYFQTYNVLHVSPLIYCIHKEDFDSAKLLIESGASINFVDTNKMTPLMHAVKTVNLILYLYNFVVTNYLFLVLI